MVSLLSSVHQLRTDFGIKNVDMGIVFNSQYLHFDCTRLR